MKYVETANTSQMSGLRNCGQIPITLGYGKHPECVPWATHMDEAGKCRRTVTANKCHRFGKPIDRSAPLLVEQEENRGNKRSRVADTDPPDKVDDREAPADGYVDAPNSDAFAESGKRWRG